MFSLKRGPVYPNQSELCQVGPRQWRNMVWSWFYRGQKQLRLLVRFVIGSVQDEVLKKTVVRGWVTGVHLIGRVSMEQRTRPSQGKSGFCGWSREKALLREQHPQWVWERNIVSTLKWSRIPSSTGCTVGTMTHVEDVIFLDGPMSVALQRSSVSLSPESCSTGASPPPTGPWYISPIFPNRPQRPKGLRPSPVRPHLHH